MAAYAALVSLMQIIHELENHPSPPISIDQQQLKSLTENVTFLEGFLERYNEADPLERRIADAAYAAEDVIESHIVDMIHLSRSTASDHDEETNSSSGDGTSSSSSDEGDTKEGTTSSSDQETKSSSGEGTSSSSGEEDDDTQEGTTTSSTEQGDSGEETTSSSSEETNHIINLNEKLKQVIEEMNLIKKEVSEINTQTAAVVHAYAASPRSSSTGQNISVVGVDDAIHEILDHLTNQHSDLQVIPIVGMGGIGKTTLAEKAYLEPLIKEHFHIRAWTTISQQNSTRKTLCDLVSQVTGTTKDQLSERSEGELGLQLYQYLFGRKFIIVVDDVWRIEAWNGIKNYFPDNKNGSRILVTTRLSDLSSQLTNNYTLQMKFLDEGSSWNLFCMSRFGKKTCPPPLEGIGKKIVENCRGLPLSIIVVGGLLGKLEDTQACWESIWKKLASLVNLDDNEHCYKLLKMSYHYLPVYLKPCFFYLGAFDEDDKIVVSPLIKLWVSEGILKPKNGESLETTAQGFLKDLVDRNLLIVDKSWLGSTRNIKYFKIHDLLRDLCIREGRKDGFYHVIGQDRPQARGINSPRRIFIPETASKEEIFDALQSMPHIRSIICSNDDDDKVQECRKSRLLRIIGARNQVDGSDGNPLVFQFANLRHATVEAHGELSINHLWNLHTLIVYSYEKLDAPVGIWNMPQLRHIEFLDTTLHLPDPPSDDVVIMENLQTLKGVENFKCSEEVVKRIPNIKRLLVEYVGSSGSNDDYYCLSNIGYLSKLESFTCEESLMEGGRIHHLQKLTLPLSIKKLTLTTSYDDDMLEKIGLLPHLQKLKMVSGSFRTGKWEVVEGQFPSLTSLSLLWCRGLKCWMAKDGSIFPYLEKLRLSRVSKLEEIPSEIGDIPTLEKIELNHCSESVVKCAKNIVYEQEELQGEITFHVSVVVSKRFKDLKSLASANFEVEVVEIA